ncbi:MAG: M48 family metallopeptidase [Saprospiraceae bacterium]|nr:M48 family metallopeptidase [Saprospiraceae bacterium]
MKKIMFFALLFLAQTALHAQDFDHYEPLMASGKIPAEFITPSSKKYKSDLKKIEAKEYRKKSDKKDRKRFALESNFVIDNLLQSGLVLYNDPVSNYLNEVATKLTEADPTIKKKVQVYALRSTTVNAFATDRGTVFVTLGLLAQLENEAQLAFILSHEITHVQDGHTLDLFLKAKKIERKSDRKSVLSESGFDEQILAKNRYSKELETEADKKGIERFLRTEYSTATLNTVFDVLKYAYLPFDEVRFERSFFEAGDYKLPEYAWLETVKAIKGEDEAVDDEKSTHPNIGARRKALGEILDKVQNRKAGSDYLVSKVRFESVRKIARFELPMLYLHRQRCADAIYSSHLLLQQHPDNAYLEKCVAKALYLNTKFENDADYTRSKSYAEVEGESQRVHYLFDTLSARDANVLALRYAWMQSRKHPEDRELSSIANDLFIELGMHVSNAADFHATAPEISATPASEPSAPAATDEKKEASKYDKIKAQKAETEVIAATDPWRSAFIGQKDEAFQKAFDDGQSKYKKRKERIDYYRSEKGRRELERISARNKKKGLSLGVSKIVIVNPFYLRLDERSDNAVQYVQSEQGQAHFREIMETVTPKAGMKATIIDVNNIKEGQTEQFNDIRTLNEWFSEQVKYDELPITYGTRQDKVNAIAEKYGTDQFLWTGVVSLREKKPSAVLTICAGIVFYPILPFAIYQAAKPEYDMLYYAILFNVKDGTYQTIKYEYFDSRDTDAILKAHYYDTLVQIKTKPKKK